MHNPTAGAARPARTITALVWRLFGACAAAIAVLAAALFWQLAGVEAIRGEAVKPRDIERKLRELGEDLLQAESAQRAYLLTGDGAYLGAYGSGIRSAGEVLSSLHASIVNPEARQVLARLDPVIAGRTAEMDRTIALARSGQREQAVRIVGGGDGKRLMDQFNALSGQIIGIEMQLVQERHQRIGTSLANAALTLILGTLAIVSALFLYTRRATRKLGPPVAALVARIESVAPRATPAAPPATARDEIERIGAAFDDMVERVEAAARERDQALQDLRRTLETLRISESELKQAKEDYRSFYEATPTMLHSIDAQGRMLSVSDLWLAKLGYRREDVLGRASSDFLAPESRERSRGVVLPALFRHGRCDNVHYQLVRADGSLMDVLLSSVLQRDASGHALRSLSVMEDISETLERKAELKREHDLRVELEQRAADLNSLLAERNEMLYVLAHEVRQPLNNASAVLQHAESTMQQRGEQAAAQRLQRAQSLLGDVLADIDNTLAVASLIAVAAPPELIDADIDTLVQIAVGDMAISDRGRVRIERRTMTRTASMDTGLMRLALRNLLANALRYSPPDSPVTLGIADSDDPLGLIFEVRDRGSGIAQDVLPRLFQRGARSARISRTSGHGLGLYIVRRVMEIHGGRAELVQSGPDGAVLRATLPQT
jgi:PAS domain S-box-containing protein